MRISAAVEIDLRNADRPDAAIYRATFDAPAGTVIKLIVDRHTVPALVIPHLPTDATVQLVADDGTTLARWHAAIRGDIA